jgi:hypothetical protein
MVLTRGNGSSFKKTCFINTTNMNWSDPKKKKAIAPKSVFTSVAHKKCHRVVSLKSEKRAGTDQEL